MATAAAAAAAAASAAAVVVLPHPPPVIHTQAHSIVLAGEPEPRRYCYQCGKLHPLSCFNGDDK
jgi:hypothetical protein